MGPLDAHTFDCWLGEWDCGFDGGRATNPIRREHNGQVVTARLAAAQPQVWNGTSMSVFNADLGPWRQTWVDDTGNYCHFVGTPVDGDPSFATPEPVDTDHVDKRMVFSDIGADSFHWRWQSSADGEHWSPNWEIDDTRRAVSA